MTLLMSHVVQSTPLPLVCCSQTQAAITGQSMLGGSWLGAVFEPLYSTTAPSGTGCRVAPSEGELKRNSCRLFPRPAHDCMPLKQLNNVIIGLITSSYLTPALPNPFGYLVSLRVQGAQGPVDAICYNWSPSAEWGTVSQLCAPARGGNVPRGFLSLL